jgi:hypothetical protein
MLLGDYLVEKGVITTETLNRALVAQKANRTPLGQLALQAGMISSHDMFRILSGQRKRGKGAPSFGRLAIELEMLNEKDIEHLLILQNQTTVLLGEALVSIGALSKMELFHSTKEYRRLRKNQQ